MKSHWKPVAATVIVALVVSCSTTVDPREANTWDLVFRNGDFKDELQRKRAHLDAVSRQLAALDEQISLALGDVHARELELSRLQSSADQQAARHKEQAEELARLRERLENAQAQVTSLESRKSALEQDLSASTQRHRELSESVQQLETEYSEIEKANRRLEEAAS